MELLLLCLQVMLGLLFFWVFEAHKYIGNGFCWTLWKQKNLGSFVWSFAVCVLLSIILFVDKGSATMVFKFMGIALEDYGKDFNLSGVISGVLLGYVTKRLTKEKGSKKSTN